MSDKRKALLVFAISVIGCAAWFLADLYDQGFGIRDLGGPVVVMGLAGIPSLAEYMKLRKSEIKKG